MNNKLKHANNNTNTVCVRGKFEGKCEEGVVAERVKNTYYPKIVKNIFE